MNQLIDTEKMTLQLVMEEYKTMLDTVEITRSNLLVFEHLYIPTIFDVISVVPGETIDDSFDNLMTIIDKYKIFFRHQEFYRNVPIEGVW